MQLFKDTAYKDLKKGDKIAIPKHERIFALLDSGSIEKAWLVKIFVIDDIELNGTSVHLKLIEDYEGADIVYSTQHFKDEFAYKVKEETEIRTIKG